MLVAVAAVTVLIEFLIESDWLPTRDRTDLEEENKA
jgi:hypothetical protein